MLSLLLPIPSFLSLRSDVPLREYIKTLNKKAPRNDRLIIRELEDGSLFVKASKVEEIRAAVASFIDKLHYEKPEATPGAN